MAAWDASEAGWGRTAVRRRQGRRAPLFPFKRALAPDIAEGQSQGADEDGHLDEAADFELPQDHGPGVDKDRLNVENNEEHGGQVKAHRETATGGLRGHDPTLVGLSLGRGRALGPKNRRDRDREHGKGDGSEEKHQEWDVFARHSEQFYPEGVRERIRGMLRQRGAGPR